MAGLIYFFLLNLIIIVIKKLSNPWVQLDPYRLGWTYVMGWVGLGWIFYQKISSTNPTWLMHTPSSKCDIFFSAQFNNNSNKKSCPTHGFNLTHMGWVGLMWWVGLNFFLVHHGGLGQKISSTDLTWLMHTPSGKCDIFFSAQFNNNSNKKKLSNS